MLTSHRSFISAFHRASIFLLVPITGFHEFFKIHRIFTFHGLSKMFPFLLIFLTYSAPVAHSFWHLTVGAVIVNPDFDRSDIVGPDSSEMIYNMHWYFSTFAVFFTFRSTFFFPISCFIFNRIISECCLTHVHLMFIIIFKCA